MIFAMYLIHEAMKQEAKIKDQFSDQSDRVLKRSIET